MSGAGTGGTIAGVSSALKSADPSIQVFLVDPQGSSLFNKVCSVAAPFMRAFELHACDRAAEQGPGSSLAHCLRRSHARARPHTRARGSNQNATHARVQVTRGVTFTREEAEGRRLRHPADTILEGVGLNRLSANFARARVDGAWPCSDAEAVEMAAYLLRNDGLFVGSSAALNCVGAVKAAARLGPGARIVTVLCDGGARHLSRFHNPEFLAREGLTPKAQGRGLEFVETGGFKPALHPGRRVEP